MIVEEIVPSVARFIGRLFLQLFWDFLPYVTARIILPLMSLGRLQVQSLIARDQVTWLWQRPFRRLPSGCVEVSVPMASAIGLMFWGVLLLWIVLRYGTG
jgi:hypothetical protein